MTNALLLKSKIALRGITQKEIGQKLGVFDGALSLKINNKQPFTLSQVKELKNLLNLTSEEVVEIFLN